MDIRTHARAEIDAINRTLANHRVDAGTAPAWTTIAGQSYLIYELKLGAQTTVATVEKRLPELAEAISALRRQRTPVRLRTMPLALEVAHPAPAPLRWQMAGVANLPPHTMLAGRSYAGHSQDETVNFLQAPHVLVAGFTGSGKSTLMLMLLLSLALNTSPTELEIHLVDLKNEDLVPLRSLPHVRSLAVTPEQAGATIARMQQLKNERVEAGRGPYRRVLLAIDELAQVAGIPGALDALGDVLSIGRSKNLNVIAATQKPTAAVTGSLAKANFACRLVGRVGDATEAALATGRRDSGAQLLPGTGGAFLRVDGAEPLRFQAYYLDGVGVDAMLQRIGQQWGGAVAAVSAPAVPVVVDVVAAAAPVEEPIPSALVAEFAVWLQADGTFRRGGLAVALRALFGPLAASGGRAYQDQCAELQRYVALWLARERKSSDAGKIVRLQEWKYRREAFPEVKAEVKPEVKVGLA